MELSTDLPLASVVVLLRVSPLATMMESAASTCSSETFSTPEGLKTRPHFSVSSSYSTVKFDFHLLTGLPSASTIGSPLASSCCVAPIAALSAAATESSVGGWVVCERSTLTVSVVVPLVSVTWNTSEPVSPEIASPCLVETAVPTTEPVTSGLSTAMV